MSRRIRCCCLCLASIGVLTGVFGGVSVAAEERGSYIVVFKEDVAAPAALAHSQAEQHDGKVGFVYRYAIKGYSVELPTAAVTALEHNPKVDYISTDGPVKIVEEEEAFLETEDNEGVEPLEATVPTGISRTFAAGNKALDVDGQDDVRANVDVAVIDTGIDKSHPDLSVVGRTDCTVKAETCADNSGTDENSHGTHVAGTIGALDNGFGVVGMAPGSRLWSVKVLNASGSGSFSQVIAGVDWVTAHASEIEVANMSIGSNSTVLALNNAIIASEEKGVVYTIAAGNQNIDVKTSPANTEPAITVSAIADYDGKPGEKSPYTCENYGLDDHKASFSNYGKLVDIAAPGVCILSAKPGSAYGVKSGTSMAAPHVAGAAALLAAKSNPNSMEDVKAITATLEETGNYNWVDTSGDGIKEPLLDVSNESVYSLVSPPVVVTGLPDYGGVGAATETFLTGTVNPKGLSTTYQFEYVEAEKYKPEAENPYAEGSKVPVSPATLTGTVDKEYEVREAVSGLKAGTVYHYRLVAENSKGTSKGGDQSFTALPACKGAGGQCEWSLQSAANPEPQTENQLEDVSCASSSMCMAVGNDRYRGRGIAEAWEGSEWKIVSTIEGEMKAISCPTTTWCMTVAKSGAKGWQLKFASGSWKAETKSPPTPEGATEVWPADVSCTSESACTAVGTYYIGSSAKPYVARWNGSSWSLQPAPSPSEGNASEAMLSVSCSSSSFCMTAGKAAGKPFAELWSGSYWTTVSVPNPEGSTEATLEGISCTSLLSCMAVGSYQASGVWKTLTERWNNGKFSIASSPNPTKEGKEGVSRLRNVSCLSASSCIAVGSFLYSPLIPQEETTLVESWNGTAWSIQSSPNPEGNLLSSLVGVSCSSSTACTAVGRSRPKLAEATNMVTLAERWNGEKWSLQSAANPEPQTENQLEDVSCASSAMCMAAGSDRYRGKGIAEVWEGSEWKILSTVEGEVKSISCPTTTWCMTVAKSGAKGWQLKFASGSWKTETKSPPTPEGATAVWPADVSCVSESACTAVGTYYIGSSAKPYVARWNGSSWSLQSAPSPSEGSADQAMSTVSCVSSSFCMTAGKAAGKPFAERWNGSEWTTVSVPGPEGGSEAILEGISCTSSIACMAVGGFEVGSVWKTLAEHWDGTKFSIVSSPNPTKEGKEGISTLQSVSCLSSSSCIAVGSFLYSPLFPQEETTLVESWNGTAWSIQSSPHPEGNLFTSLAGVSCTSSVACTAVGRSRPKLAVTNMVTLAERWQ